MSDYPSKTDNRGSYFRDQIKYLTEYLTDIEVYLLRFNRRTVSQVDIKEKSAAKVLSLKSNCFFKSKFNIHVFTKFQKRLEMRYLIFQIKRFNSSFNSSVIQAASHFSESFYYLKLQDKNLLGKIIMFEHNIIFFQNEFHRKLSRKGFLKSDVLLVTSNDRIRQFKLNGIFSDREIINIGNPVDTNYFNPNCHQSLMRNSEERPVKLLVITYDNPVKDIWMLYMLILTISSEIQSGRCLLRIVGLKPLRGGELSIWANNIMAMKMTNLIFLDNLCRDDVRRVYEDTDALLVTSNQEGFSLVTHEAISMGIPVFSTICGGVEDIINIQNGRLVAVGDFRAMSQIIMDFMDRKILFDQDTVRSTILGKFDPNIWVRRFYKELL